MGKTKVFEFNTKTMADDAKLSHAELSAPMNFIMSLMDVALLVLLDKNNVNMRNEGTYQLRNTVTGTWGEGRGFGEVGRLGAGHYLVRDKEDGKPVGLVLISRKDKTLV